MARLYQTTDGQPFIVGQEAVAHSGKVAIVRTATSDNLGKPMVVRFRTATAAEVIAWISLAEGTTPFNTTSLDSDFDTGYVVIFSQNKPIFYENELGLKDIEITDSTLLASKTGFDLWRGVLNLIVVDTEAS